MKKLTDEQHERIQSFLFHEIRSEFQHALYKSTNHPNIPRLLSMMLCTHVMESDGPSVTMIHEKCIKCGYDRWV